MENNYTTYKIEGRYKTMRVAGIILIGLSLVYFVSAYNRDSGIAGMVLYPAFGLFLLIHSQLMLKKIAGSFITFKEDGISYKTRKAENKFLSYSEIERIYILPKTIELYCLNGNADIIYLEDYSSAEVKEGIKEHFERIKSGL